MKQTGAQLARFALEQLGVRFTFGIPGVHNTELYDELVDSATIRPVRVTHEGGAAFMADAVSRTSDSIGTLVIVPAAGVTLASSGIAEAFLDGIPMLVITGGVRTDSPYHYQVHEIDQMRLVEGYTKARYRIRTHAEIVPTLYEAYRIAISGEPGPVFVEIPVNIQLFPAEVEEPAPYTPNPAAAPLCDEAIAQAVDLLTHARQPGLFLGWGAHGASDLIITLAERLNAPVATSLQGLSVFPASHPLHTGMGFGPAAVPAATEAFRHCDCLLAVGVRFGEIATGSYGIRPSWRLIHVDINPDVFNVNYPADVAIAGDARAVLQRLLADMPATDAAAPRTDDALRARIRDDKSRYHAEWLAHDSGTRVNPARFFDRLRAALQEDAIVVADDGNHTFLVAELFPVLKNRHFISPTDFNCMGYCVPAAIGAKLAHPQQQVVGIVGDGAFLMTCMETLTATELKLGIVYFVFHDGELSQIAQAQKLPYNRKACSILPDIQIRGVAEATGAAFLSMQTNDDVGAVIGEALRVAGQNRPVIVDVNIDYSKATRFTQGVIKSNFARMPARMKLRMAGRALLRRVRPPETETS
ncbi:thiamine pyrophosphate-binding protein [Sinimarinibacterium sp. CAU 1509]|uniref:thiamine pyrophosphate-binding protein n=1 Tax=Sinimarinibacterium sp. CAU 1509 TaxID=2562283 RepID=UPI0010ABD6D2|nr:thiamine pyrophosphate-binding protein [Sinimarinibacterium sp. CAU 1509]TJY56208.1 thiamine pyrophosphate-binding protein [Sinimarinibacterium sp. CAU 1509]